LNFEWQELWTLGNQDVQDLHPHEEILFFSLFLSSFQSIQQEIPRVLHFGFLLELFLCTPKLNFDGGRELLRVQNVDAVNAVRKQVEEIFQRSIQLCLFVLVVLRVKSFPESRLVDERKEVSVRDSAFLWLRNVFHNPVKDFENLVKRFQLS
jgi:hypothetical protein